MTLCSAWFGSAQGEARSEMLTNTLIDFLMGESDGVPKDPKFIFRVRHHPDTQATIAHVCKAYPVLRDLRAADLRHTRTNTRCVDQHAIFVGPCMTLGGALGAAVHGAREVPGGGTKF